MDPNANLREQLELAHLVADNENSAGFDLYDAIRLGELVIALNAWILAGGFLPDKWEVAQKKHLSRKESTDE